MKTTSQKTVVLTFRTTPEFKAELMAAAKAEGMDASPYIDNQLKLLSKFYGSEQVTALFNKYEFQTANLLTRNGKRVYVKLNSKSDILRYYLGVDDSYARLINQLIRERRYLNDFASQEEKKIAEEEDNEQ